ncbi:hypothetical protein G7Y79_00005g017660 [Physcia stellaris]|nr:hypothetical protein G7Y79_00005g017660 [Physcia stellaris]
MRRSTNAVRCRAQDVNSSINGLNDTTLDSSARTLLEVLPESITTGKYGPDAIPVGNYTLLGCGPDVPGSKADHLKVLLPIFLNRLEQVIADTRMGISGFHGYRIFFKESAVKETVEAVFQNIQNGSAVRLQTRRGDVVRTPKIVCLGEDEDEAHVTGIGNLAIPENRAGGLMSQLLSIEFLALVSGVSEEGEWRMVSGRNKSVTKPICDFDKSFVWAIHSTQ